VTIDASIKGCRTKKRRYLSALGEKAKLPHIVCVRRRPTRKVGSVHWEEISMANISAITIPQRYIRKGRLSQVGVVAVAILWAVPAFAVSGAGVSASCSVVNPNRYECIFAAFSTSATVEIQYASMQCGSTGNSFSLQEFQVLTTPPGSSSQVAYQIPVTNQASLGGVVTAGSPVTLYAKAGIGASALIDLSPAPTGTTQCTVSLSLTP
jgi:hypothetical protein